jgi:hypothetical protein
VQQQQPQLQEVLQQQLAPQVLLHQELQVYVPLQQQERQRLLHQLPKDRKPGQPAVENWLLLLLLCHLASQHSSSMRSQQLCTCLNSMALLLQRHTQITLLAVPVLRSALQQLLQQANQQMEELSPAGLSVLVAALAVIARAPGGLAPSRAFMNRWYRASWRCMRESSGLDLAMAAWGLGQMRECPSSSWVARFWVCSKVSHPCCCRMSSGTTEGHPPVFASPCAQCC